MPLIISSYVNKHYDANLRDLLENLFGCSSPVARSVFSSEVVLLHFAIEVTVDLFAALICANSNIVCYKGKTIR